MKKISLVFYLCFVTFFRVCGEDQKLLSFGAIMSQERLFAQKDALQTVVKGIWDNCLKKLDEIFPGLAEEDPYNKNIINVKWNFDKQPKTNENIILIKKIVQDVLAKTTMPLINFDIKITQEQSLKSMLERMIVNAFIELVLNDVGKSLGWCTCTAEYKRITLALLLVNEVREKFTNKNQRIVYTSLASGSLLQDYIILSELLLSHTHILINLIDLEYPDVPALAKKDFAIEYPQDLHTLEMKNKQEQAEIIDSFKVKIAQIISEKSTADYNFEFNVYQNAYEYIVRVQRNPSEKSNILLMVDPNTGSFGIADYPSLANVINVWVDQENKPVFTLYLPRHHGVHLYQALEIANKPVEAKIMQYLHNKLLDLIVRTGASKHYTPNLVKVLLDKVMFSDVITDELLTTEFPRLMEKRAAVREQALISGYSGDNLLQPLTPIQLGDMPVLLSWGTDAHISLQDLVWDALAPNGIVYQLYGIDPAAIFDEKNDKIIKINPELYKKVDVVVPNSGKASTVRMKELGDEDLYKKAL